MERLNRRSAGSVRLAVFSLLAVMLFAGNTLPGGGEVSFNHSVLVEGNCEGPAPSATQVNPGACGDYDGDGRIGTAEDTDGPDRIFGTINAALGNLDLGAATNPTTAQLNGRVVIVTSGRFAEAINVRPNVRFPAMGNVQVEAAKGVEAGIEAVLQGDSAGANAVRQESAGIEVTYAAPNRVVTLRNLTIRNFAVGIVTRLNSRVHVDNCRVENNLHYGIRVTDSSNVIITGTQVSETGYRGPDGGANPGDGISVQDSARATISHTNVWNSVGAGINNDTGSAANVAVHNVRLHLNNPDISGDGIDFATSSASDSRSFSLTMTEDGFSAKYTSELGVILTELQRQGNRAVVRVREASLGDILTMEVPPEAPEFLNKEVFENGGRLVLQEGFRRATLQEQAFLLTPLARSSRLIARELEGRESAATLVAVEAMSKFLGARLERADVNNPPPILLIGRNDGRCHGACGPGCDWCFCRGRWCACEVNLFCYAHDSCCGAWSNFFNCFPCSWQSWWRVAQ